jgi:hypothetical protein
VRRITLSHSSKDYLGTNIYTHIFQDYDAEDLKDFEETILQGVGYDKEGKISRKELTMILLTLAKMPSNEQ